MQAELFAIGTKSVCVDKRDHVLLMFFRWIFEAYDLL
jgi:hypothetical protein